MASNRTFAAEFSHYSAERDIQSIAAVLNAALLLNILTIAANRQTPDISLFGIDLMNKEEEA
ncbi:MAG: hypothetical protein LQ347_003054 [Umbilicaria vellea]|nr:MAG: hypothetical protein LQ347_003054 [Umbilicaria vellea]